MISDLGVAPSRLQAVGIGEERLKSTGCVTSEDTAHGGLFNGISGATGGGYDVRVADREKISG